MNGGNTLSTYFAGTRDRETGETTAVHITACSPAEALEAADMQERERRNYPADDGICHGTVSLETLVVLFGYATATDGETHARGLADLEAVLPGTRRVLSIPEPDQNLPASDSAADSACSARRAEHSARDAVESESCAGCPGRFPGR